MGDENQNQEKKLHQEVETSLQPIADSGKKPALAEMEAPDRVSLELKESETTNESNKAQATDTRAWDAMRNADGVLLTARGAAGMPLAKADKNFRETEKNCPVDEAALALKQTNGDSESNRTVDEAAIASKQLDDSERSNESPPEPVSDPTLLNEGTQDHQPVTYPTPYYVPRLAIPEQSYGAWKQISEMSATLQFFIWIILGIGALIAGYWIISFLPHDGPEVGDVIQSWLAQSGLSKHTSGIEQLLKFFPLAAIGCAVTSYMVIYASARSRSRQIDWTDSHLIMEYSGPLSLALKWSAITSVKQDSQWELFHGKQPLFIIKTQEDNEFKLRLSDISHKHNIGEFFSLIKTNAPAAELNVDSSFASDNSYTELWLKYFSAPSERERTGLLKEGMLLDEGRYRVMGTIGGGGQGTAYLATFDPAVAPVVYDEDWQPDLLPEEQAAPAPESMLKQSHHIMHPDHGLYENTQVVLKEYVLPVHRGHLTAERTADKLKAEAKILQQLQHPQIVNLLDAFIEDYRGYLVLEYVAGESLKSLVERLGPQPESAVIDWAQQVCSILRYLHSLTPPVVHRDITPDNLLLQEDGTIKIVDFNVAYQVDSSATATVVGKHAYIPAEQFRGKPTPQSDVYALGGTIFYLLTAREPEPITESHPKEISERVTAELDSIVGKATRHSLADRYADVDELSAALNSLLK